MTENTKKILEVVSQPFEYIHSEGDAEALSKMICHFPENQKRTYPVDCFVSIYAFHFCFLCLWHIHNTPEEEKSIKRCIDFISAIENEDEGIKSNCEFCRLLATVDNERMKLLSALEARTLETAIRYLLRKLLCWQSVAETNAVIKECYNKNEVELAQHFIDYVEGLIGDTPNLFAD